MKYTHYISTTHGPVRGNLVNFSPTATKSIRDFEQITGLAVARFTRNTSPHGYRDETVVTLMDGTELIFDTFRSRTSGQLFYTEDGRYISVRPWDNIAKCAENPYKTYRVVFDSKTCTTFISFEEASSILDDIAEGHGVVFTNNRNGLQTALPHHSIKRAILTEAPFGGHI